MRFDEFVAWTDAAGFGTGIRAPHYMDWARIVAWSVVSIAVTGVSIGILFGTNM